MIYATCLCGKHTLEVPEPEWCIHCGGLLVSVVDGRDGRPTLICDSLECPLYFDHDFYKKTV